MIQIVSHQYGIEGVGWSLQGGRPENQDDMGCLETPQGFLLVVCDGMGGGPGGKTASHIVRQTVIETVANCPAQASPADALKMAVSKANEALEQAVAQQPSLRGMGSTLVALIVSAHSAVVAHLGDSRCYLLRGSKMVYKSNDHSLVGELVRSGAITEEQARTSPQSNVITRAMGSTDNHIAEIDELPYRRGDRFVLCTDGIWGIMPHRDLLLRLTSGQEVSTIVTSLSEEVDNIGASQGGHHDNHTLAVVEVKQNSKLEQPMNKKNKILLAAGGVLLAGSVLLNILTLNRSHDEQSVGWQEKVDSLEEENNDLVAQLSVLQDDYDRSVADFENYKNQLSDSKKTTVSLFEALTEERDRLASQVDSLNREVASMRLLMDNKGKQGRKEVKAADPNIDKAIVALKALADIKENKPGEAARKAKKYVTDALAALQQLHLSGQNKKTVEDFIKELQRNDIFKESKNVVGSIDGYIVKKNTKERALKMVDELRGMKK